MINRTMIFVLGFALGLLLHCGCQNPLIIDPGDRFPGHQSQADKHQQEIKELKKLPVKARIEEYIRRYPTIIEPRHEECGTPGITTLYNFVSLLDNVSTQELVPLLEHRAGPVRGAVHEILKKRKASGYIAINWAFRKGSDRIRLELLQHVKPNASDDEKYKMLDKVIHNPQSPVFNSDILFFSDIRSYLAKDYPFDVILYYRRMIMESEFMLDKVDALNALKRFKSDAVPAVPDYIKILNDEDQVLNYSDWNRQAYPDDYTFRCLIAEAVCDIGPAASEATPTLIKLLNDPNLYIPIHARTALFIIGHEPDKMLQELIDRLKSETSLTVLPVLCNDLGKIGPPVSLAIPTLVKLAKHDDKNVRFTALQAIAIIDDSSDRYFQLMKENLKHPNPDVRKDTIQLFSSKSYFKEGEKGLYEALKDPDPNVKYAACDALLKNGVSKDVILLTLIEAINTGKPMKRVQSAVELLTSFGGQAKAAIPGLLKMMESDDQQTVQICSNAVLLVDGDYDIIMKRFIELIKHKDEGISCANMNALKNFGDTGGQTLQALREQYFSGIEKRKSAALDTIKRIVTAIRSDSPVSEEDLIAVLDCGYLVCSETVRALRTINADKSKVVDKLLELVSKEKDYKTQQEYIKQLKELGYTPSKIEKESRTRKPGESHHN